MTFELEAFTKAKLLDHATLSQKDRDPDENPGQALKFEMTISNDVLSMFDGQLRTALYTKSAASPKKQGEFDGMAVTDLPNLTGIGAHVKRLPWAQEYTGMRLTIDYGMGAASGSNLELLDCTVYGFTFQPKEGGSVLMKFKLDAPDVSEAIAGKLPKLKSREVQLMLLGPVVDDGQSDIEDPAPAPKAKGGKKAAAAPAENPFPIKDEKKGAGGFAAGTPEAALSEAAGLPR